MSGYVKLKVGESTYDKLSLNDKIKVDVWLTECEQKIEQQLEEATNHFFFFFFFFLAYGSYTFEVGKDD